MAKCPICKEDLIGFNWTKTKTGKNWLADGNGEWHNCPKNQSSFSKSSSSSSSYKKYDPFNGDKEAEARYKKAIDEKIVYCDICEINYRLREPCDHHIPDGYQWKERRAMAEKRRKGTN